MKFNKSVMKQIFASSHLKFSLIILIILIAMFNIFFQFGIIKILLITHQETKEVYLEKTVIEGDVVKYSWIHSFEHIPWTEDFEILEDNKLKLNKITVAGYGAGIPENKGKVSIEDGIIVMKEINQVFDEINWINSNTALTFIGINDNEIIKGNDLPHHEPLNLKIKERFSIWPRFR